MTRKRLSMRLSMTSGVRDHVFCLVALGREELSGILNILTTNAISV